MALEKRIESWTGREDGFHATRGVYMCGQTFTASKSYDLAGVKIFAYRDSATDPGTITVKLYATSGGLPTGSALATGTYTGTDLLEGSTLDDWHKVEFTSAYSVTSGTVYAITVESSGSSISMRTGYDTASTYAGGTYIYSSDGGSNWFTLTRDLCFQCYEEISAIKYEDHFFTTTATIFTVDSTNDHICQTFTTDGGFQLEHVNLLVYNQNYTTDIGEAYIDIYAVDVDSKPTGASLASATVDNDFMAIETPKRSTIAQANTPWVTFTLPAPLVLADSTEYAIVYRTQTANTSHKSYWTKTNATPVYADGEAWFSTDGGSVWNGPYTDMIFEVWGNSSATYVDASATVTTEVEVEVDAALAGYVDASATVEADVEVDVTAVVKQEVSGSALTDNKRIVAVGNNELWYEDI